jgi:hypothetical protein
MRRPCGSRWGGHERGLEGALCCVLKHHVAQAAAPAASGAHTWMKAGPAFAGTSIVTPQHQCTALCPALLCR